MVLTREQKEQMVRSINFWYHTIELGDGLFTPGWENVREFNKTMISFLPFSFKGMSVLDIGCYDGLFSFEAEKRGAEKVLAIDNLCGGDGVTKKQMSKYRPDGFKPLITAREILNSKIEYKERNVYNISPTKLGKFDCTFFFGVLYHLWHPMLALQKIFQVTNKCLFIETHVNEEIDQTKPLIQFYPRNEKYEYTTWVGPNLLALYEMLTVVGFKKVILYIFRDFPERAIGVAFVTEEHSKEFQFEHDQRFILFDPSAPTRDKKD
jgi:tRNA (mo5U34)-methyltransferase